LEVPTTFAGGESSCAREIPVCQSFIPMASGDPKGKMNYRVWPVLNAAAPEATYRAAVLSARNMPAPSLTHGLRWPTK
jgi:hypothetical protein